MYLNQVVRGGDENLQKSTSFFPVGVLVAFSKYEFRPVNRDVARWVMP